MRAMEGEESDMPYTYKVLLCNVGYRHDWKLCPFYHHGERARRRDPRMYFYQPIYCGDYRWPNRRCPREDSCHNSHGFWEVGYHPDRFRTKPCWFGSDCRRAFCCFAHPRRDRIIRGPQNNNRNTNDYYASSSSAAVVPQAMDRVHDHQTVRPPAVIRHPTSIPSENQRANEDDNASPNSPPEPPVTPLPDLFGQWRLRNSP